MASGARLALPLLTSDQVAARTEKDDMKEPSILGLTADLLSRDWQYGEIQ